MTAIEIYSTLFALGMYHGINPGMGWLFAVAIGMQTKSRQKIITSLIGLTLGHATSITAVILLVGLLEQQLPFSLLQILLAGLLIGLGIYHIFRTGHPSWFGMQPGFIGISLWSFFMASAHGASLMLIPFLLDGSALGLGIFSYLSVIGIHTLGYLLVATILAFLVYEKLGVLILRKAWLNFDLIWATTLIITGGFLILVV